MNVFFKTFIIRVHMQSNFDLFHFPISSIEGVRVVAFQSLLNHFMTLIKPPQFKIGFRQIVIKQTFFLTFRSKKMQNLFNESIHQLKIIGIMIIFFIKSIKKISKVVLSIISNDILSLSKCFLKMSPPFINFIKYNLTIPTHNILLSLLDLILRNINLQDLTPGLISI